MRARVPHQHFAPQAGSRSAPRSRSRYRNPEGCIPDSELEVSKETYGDGSVRVTYHYNGQLHRDDGPALVRYWSDGSVELEAWYQHGTLHRDDGPAMVEYGPWGAARCERWFQRGADHRDDGPAMVVYRSDGSVERVGWRLNNK